MAIEVVRGARIGHPTLRYGFEFVLKGRLCGVQVEFDEQVADTIMRTDDPSLIGPRSEWFHDDDMICDRLGEILTAWVATFPLEDHR